MALKNVICGRASGQELRLHDQHDADADGRDGDLIGERHSRAILPRGDAARTETMDEPMREAVERAERAAKIVLQVKQREQSRRLAESSARARGDRITEASQLYKRYLDGQVELDDYISSLKDLGL